MVHNVCHQHYRLWLRTGRFTHERLALTAADVRAIRRARSEGLTLAEASRKLGIAKRTLHRGITRGVGSKPGWNLRARG